MTKNTLGLAVLMSISLLAGCSGTESADTSSSAPERREELPSDFSGLMDAYIATFENLNEKLEVHPVNGEVPPVKGRPRKLPHYANRGKTSSSGGELASARSCFSTVRTALGKLRITGLLAQFDIARSFPQFPRPLLLQPTILTSERGTRFGIRKAPNHVPPPHLPDDPNLRVSRTSRTQSRWVLLCRAS